MGKVQIRTGHQVPRMKIVDEDVEEYVYERTKPAPDLLEELAKFTLESMSSPDMLTGRVEGRLLKLLVKISGAKIILECGTYTGYSALSMAEGLPEDGKLITCEHEAEHRDVAEEYFSKSPHGKKIEVRFGDALEILKEFELIPDMIFLDADKERYPEYYEASVDKLPPGGLIVIDNALWEGEVIRPETGDAKAIAEMNDRIASDPRVENVLLTVRDGIQIVRKR